MSTKSATLKNPNTQGNLDSNAVEVVNQPQSTKPPTITVRRAYLARIKTEKTEKLLRHLIVVTWLQNGLMDGLVTLRASTNPVGTPSPSRSSFLASCWLSIESKKGLENWYEHLGSKGLLVDPLDRFNVFSSLLQGAGLPEEDIALWVDNASVALSSPVPDDCVVVNRRRDLLDLFAFIESGGKTKCGRWTKQFDIHWEPDENIEEFADSPLNDTFGRLIVGNGNTPSDRLLDFFASDQDDNSKRAVDGHAATSFCSERFGEGGHNDTGLVLNIIRGLKNTISTVKNPQKTSCGKFLENWAKSCSLDNGFATVSMTVEEMGEHFASRKGRVSSESDLFLALSAHSRDFLGSPAPGSRSSITYEQWIVRVVTNRLPLLERRSDRPPKGRTWWSEMLVSLAANAISSNIPELNNQFQSVRDYIRSNNRILITGFNSAFGDVSSQTSWMSKSLKLRLERSETVEELKNEIPPVAYDLIAAYQDHRAKDTVTQEPNRYTVSIRSVSDVDEVRTAWKHTTTSKERIQAIQDLFAEKKRIDAALFFWAAETVKKRYQLINQEAPDDTSDASLKPLSFVNSLEQFAKMSDTKRRLENTAISKLTLPSWPESPRWNWWNSNLMKASFVRKPQRGDKELSVNLSVTSGISTEDIGVDIVSNRFRREILKNLAIENDDKLVLVPRTSRIQRLSVDPKIANHLGVQSFNTVPAISISVSNKCSKKIKFNAVISLDLQNVPKPPVRKQLVDIIGKRDGLNIMGVNLAVRAPASVSVLRLTRSTIPPSKDYDFQIKTPNDDLFDAKILGVGSLSFAGRTDQIKPKFGINSRFGITELLDAKNISYSRSTPSTPKSPPPWVDAAPVPSALRAPRAYKAEIIWLNRMHKLVKGEWGGDGTIRDISGVKSRDVNIRQDDILFEMLAVMRRLLADHRKVAKVANLLSNISQNEDYDDISQRIWKIVDPKLTAQRPMGRAIDQILQENVWEQMEHQAVEDDKMPDFIANCAQYVRDYWINEDKTMAIYMARVAVAIFGTHGAWSLFHGVLGKSAWNYDPHDRNAASIWAGLGGWQGNPAVKLRLVDRYVRMVRSFASRPTPSRPLGRQLSKGFLQRTLNYRARLRKNVTLQVASGIVGVALANKCKMIVLEDLAQYRPNEIRSKGENDQLMLWAHRQIVEAVQSISATLGIVCKTVNPSGTSQTVIPDVKQVFSSKQSKNGTKDTIEKGSRGIIIPRSEMEDNTGFMAALSRSASQVERYGDKASQAAKAANSLKDYLNDTTDSQQKDLLKSAQNVFKPTTDGEWFAPTGRNVPDWLIVEKGNVTGADTNAATNIGMRGAEWILFDGGGSK
jgi:IS605 OrfB family transposase